MLAAAARSFDVPPQAVVMIGDAYSDIEAGRRFGARTIHLTAGPSPSPLVARDLPAAVELVVAR
jgi:phosphoglycolate phosphatase-like HAD superfamily hydrolase